MRTNDILKDRQQTTAFTPYLDISYYSSGPPHDAGGSWVEIAKTTDATLRILRTEESGEQYGGELIIELDNHESTYDAYSLEGLWIRPRFGALATNSDVIVTTTEDPPYFFVKKQWFETDTHLGKDRYYIYVIGMWLKLAMWVADDDYDSAIATDDLYGLTVKEIVSAIMDKAGMFLGISISECSLVDSATWKPTGFTISQGEDGRSVVKRLLALTKCTLIPRADGGVLKYLNPAEAKCYDFQTNAAHYYRRSISESALFKPMKVTVADITGAYTYTETHAKWQAGMGSEYIIDPYGLADSNDDCQFLAESIVAAAAYTADSGYLHARTMNCLLEIHDVIEITDAMGNTSQTGRVGGFLRRFITTINDDGTKTFDYDIAIRLGGTTRMITEDIPGISMSELVEQMGLTPGIPGSFLQEHSIYPMSLRNAIQPYVSDIAWSSTGIANATWGAGTITFADGTPLAIDSGSKADIDGTYLAYFIEGNSTIQWTTDWTVPMGASKGLLAMCILGVAPDSKAYIKVVNGKQDVINCLVLYANMIVGAYIAAGEIDLDSHVADGSTYGRLLNTHMDAHGIKISSLTDYAGVWYNKSGIELDADFGIDVYGTDMAFTTSKDTGVNTSAFSEFAPSHVIVTAAGHGLSTGDQCIIRGTTNYDGKYTVSTALASTFRIVHSWDGNAGDVIGDVYQVQASVNSDGAIVAGAGEITLNKNGIQRTNSGYVETANILNENVVNNFETADYYTTLDEGYIYTISGIVINADATNPTFSDFYVKLIVADSEAAEIANDYSYAFTDVSGTAQARCSITFFSGIIGGGTAPTVTLRCGNKTGSTIHFHGYLKVSKAL